MTEFPLFQILFLCFVAFRALFQSSELILSLCGIFGGRSDIGAGFSMSISVFPPNSYSTNIPFSHLSSGAGTVQPLVA